MVEACRHIDECSGAEQAPGQGINPCFLWDNASYLLGWSSDADADKAARAALAFEAFRKKHLELEDRIAHPAFTAVCSFFDMVAEKARDHAEILKEIAANFGVFRIAGQMQYVHDLISLPAETEEQSAASEAGTMRTMCLFLEPSMR